MNQQNVPPHSHHSPRGYDVDRMLDASGLIVTAGQPQLLFDAPVRGYEILNPDGTHDLWVSDMGHPCVANGVGCIRVAMNGGAYWTPVHVPPLWQEVYVVGSVNGQPYTARYW